MKGYLAIYLIIFLLGLIGKSWFGFNLVLPFILALGFHFSGSVGFTAAFFAGCWLSLLGGSGLGLPSLGLVLSLAIIYLYARRFSSQNLLFFLALAAAGSLVFSLVTGRSNYWWQAVLDLALAAVFLPLVSRLKEKFFSEAVILKV